jgi:hypothetical protein
VKLLIEDPRSCDGCDAAVSRRLAHRSRPHLRAGGAGNDLLAGDSENDDLGGGIGDDRPFGGTSVDRLSGDSGMDTRTAGGDAGDTAAPPPGCDPTT